MYRTTCGANMAAKMANALIISKTKLMIDEANFHAFSFCFCTKNVENVGMKADANAPPATKLNNTSDTRLAAQKASFSIPVPNALRITTPFAKLITLLITYAIITVPAAIAI